MLPLHITLCITSLYCCVKHEYEKKIAVDVPSYSQSFFIQFSQFQIHIAVKLDLKVKGSELMNQRNAT